MAIRLYYFYNMSEAVPRLWSDFDGTAVAIAKKSSPRNWSKYPLPGLDGYIDFLKGVHLTGVEIAGIVTRRPDISVRRLATARSIRKLGYADFFNRPEQLVHTGSEEAKGRFIAEQSRVTTIGMLEDKPHKLGSVLLGALTEPRQYPRVSHHPILIGAVLHARSQEYMERLIAQASTITTGNLCVTEFAHGVATAPTAGFTLESEFLSLHVVPLQTYSEQAGSAFGRTLLGIAA